MDYKVIEVKENLLIENEKKAKELRDKLTRKWKDHFTGESY